MEYFLATVLLMYLTKAYYVHKLRQKRDRIDFTTKQGKLEILRINNLIDFLNGAWIFIHSKKKA
ncbi:hypothetical protein [Flagellimonas taeanensis]|uniref:hypothetical protein n=1 Tax=Flagellimonas taeanensis TaxID=1005926 RepID=UPI0011C42CE5|nr:hypothetical protein [Allomuricauda taeanensis]